MIKALFTSGDTLSTTGRYVPGPFMAPLMLHRNWRYDIRLWDLPSNAFCTVTIDDRLPAISSPSYYNRSDTARLLSARLSSQQELWVPLLEKAVCVHAGGWAKLQGGQPTFAFALLTGCLESYSVTKLEDEQWHLFTRDWSSFTGNSPQVPRLQRAVHEL